MKWSKSRGRRRVLQERVPKLSGAQMLRDAAREASRHRSGERFRAWLGAPEDPDFKVEGKGS
jgi:hypothetical protein